MAAFLIKLHCKSKGISCICIKKEKIADIYESALKVYLQENGMSLRRQPQEEKVRVGTPLALA